MDFFDRCWELKIQFENYKLKTYTQRDQANPGLKLDFTANTGINTAATTGSITVAGLLAEDLAFLATNYIPGGGQLRTSLVELSAGYSGSLSLLLYGNIFETVPTYTGTADYSISMKVNNGLQQNQLNKHTSISFKGRVTLRDICENVAKQLNCTLELESSLTTRSLENYSYQGTPMQLLETLHLHFPDLQYTLVNKSLRIFTEKNKQRIKYTLTTDTGLLGTPQPTPQGVTCTCYLLPHLYSGDFIELKSVKMKQLNAVYKIIMVQHQGSSRGDAWKTTLTLRRGV